MEKRIKKLREEECKGKKKTRNINIVNETKERKGK
jgi:hypothetical protein